MRSSSSSQPHVASGANRVQVTPQVIISRNPRTHAVLGQVHIATPLEISHAYQEARIGQVAWHGIGLKQRLVFIRALRDVLYRQQETIVNTLVAEQGKVAQEARFELLAMLEQVEFYLTHSPAILQPREVPVRLQPHRRYIIEHRPFGVMLVIAPWNYPLFLSLGPIVGALVAGNSVIYKPSEYAPLLGEAIASVIQEAGIPQEVFHILHGYGDVGAALIEAHPDAIVFTGSVPTGKKIARAAAEKLIPVTLELGGKDAAVVLEDADIKRAAAGIVWSGMFNAGQTCASVERVIVVRRVAEALVSAMKAEIARSLLQADGQAGPSLASVSTPEQINIVETQVAEAVAGGATLVTGGTRISEAGHQMYAPTILTGVTPDMRICREETFGPVISVFVVEDEQEAVKLNNATDFGLTASIWTRDRRRGMRVARQLEVGHVSVNDHLIISGISELPWGGIKASGYGRTRGWEGLQSMTYTQTIDVDKSPFSVAPFWYPYNAIRAGLLKRVTHGLYGPSLRDKLRALL